MMSKEFACDCLLFDNSISTSSLTLFYNIPSHNFVVNNKTPWPATLPRMSTPRFQNYPAARKGPEEPYKKEDLALPVLRGQPLSIGATVYV